MTNYNDCKTRYANYTPHILILFSHKWKKISPGMLQIWAISLSKYFAINIFDIEAPKKTCKSALRLECQKDWYKLEAIFESRSGSNLQYSGILFFIYGERKWASANCALFFVNFFSFLSSHQNVDSFFLSCHKYQNVDPFIFNLFFILKWVVSKVYNKMILSFYRKKKNCFFVTSRHLVLHFFSLLTILQNF